MPIRPRFRSFCRIWTRRNQATCRFEILTKPLWIGRKKARSAAAWAEELGFRTALVERRFVAGNVRHDGEPTLALVGVDNLPSRRAAASSNFDLLFDAGLGATAPEIFDIRVHGFPGARVPEKCWPEQNANEERPLSRALQDLVDSRRIDRCGAMTIAGRSVGVPATAVAAAAIQVAQACRAVSEGSYCDLVDVSLADCARARVSIDNLPRVGSLEFVRAR